MSECKIDAEFKCEERYSKLSFVYNTDKQLTLINEAIEKYIEPSDLDKNIYTSDVTHNRKVIVIEFHDDYDRLGGELFEKMMKDLDIDTCIS